MTNLTRRAAFASIPAIGLAPIVPAMTEPVDPIIEAIAAYEAGNAAYERHPICRTLDWTDEDMNVVVEATYGPSLRTLDEWTDPAVSRERAIAALRFVVEESRNFKQSDGVDAMVKAALAYLEANT